MEPFKMPNQVVLKNARILDPALNLDQRGDLLIEGGVIQRLDAKIAGKAVWDLNGAIVSPGCFDLHVHLREPGNEDAETIRSGQEAAAAGGFSAVAAMPNTSPPLDQPGIVRWVIEQSELFAPVGVYPIAAVTKGRKGEELTDMVELHQAGAVAFSDDGSHVSSSEVMRRALEYSLLVDAPIITHAEDASLSKNGAMHEGEISTRLGLAGIPDISEDIATIRDLKLAEYTGGKLHLAHISTRGSLAALEAALRRGVRATGEATPHHLLLTDAAVIGYDTSTKMKPPLRTEKDRLALWDGLRKNFISVIATDHAPHTFDDKEVPYDEAAFGVIGLETALALIWDRGVLAGLIEPEQLIRFFCHGPRTVVGLPIPALQEGQKAELTVFHPEEKWRVERDRFFSKSKNSPFKGWELTGRPWGVLRGLFWAGRVEPDLK